MSERIPTLEILNRTIAVMDRLDKTDGCYNRYNVELSALTLEKLSLMSVNAIETPMGIDVNQRILELISRIKETEQEMYSIQAEIKDLVEVAETSLSIIVAEIAKRREQST